MMKYEVLQSFVYKGELIEKGSIFEPQINLLFTKEMLAAGRLAIAKPPVPKVKKEKDE